MAKQTLNLGAVLSDILKNSNSNFTELYDAIAEIQEKIADDGEKAVVYSTVDKMITGLNAGTDEAGKALDITIGDEIYILDDETPDFWVSAVSTTSTTGTKPSSWEKGTNYTFGKYTIRVSKSREIDLADYQKIVNMETGTSPTDDTTKTKYPSSYTVYTWVNSIKSALDSSISTLNDQAHTHDNKTLLDDYTQTETNLAEAVSKKHSHSNQEILDDTTASYTTEEKTKLANIDSSLMSVTADEIGKVKDVKVGEKSVLGEDGVAVISIDDLAGGFISIAADDSSCWTTQTINGTTYQAIRFQKTDTALGVFNSSGQEIVIQKTYDANYLYLCVGTSKIACIIRNLSGGAVGTGGGSSPTYTLSKETKYLHQISLAVMDDNTPYVAHINFINESSIRLSSFSSLFSAMNKSEYQGIHYPAWGYKKEVNSEGLVTAWYDIYYATVESTNDTSRQNRIWFTCVGYSDNTTTPLKEFAILKTASNVTCYDNVVTIVENVSLNQA